SAVERRTAGGGSSGGGGGAISSAADVAQAMHDAKPGDVITLADGHWKDQLISITGKGTAENPITVRAQTPGKVILEGDSRVIIFGEHVIVSGLMFTDSDSKQDAIQISGIENRVTETAI